MNTRYTPTWDLFILYQKQDWVCEQIDYDSYQDALDAVLELYEERVDIIDHLILANDSGAREQYWNWGNEPRTFKIKNGKVKAWSL